MTEEKLLNNSFLYNYSLYTQWQEAPNDFHFWVACTLVGAITQRKVYFDQFYYKLFPNLYTCITAESAICKKSTAADIGMKIFRQAIDGTTLEGVVFEGKITPKGLVKKICFKPGQPDHDAVAFIYVDEMGVFFGGDMIKLGIVDLITALYMCPDVHDYITAESGTFKVENAFLSILALGVPSYLIGNVNDVMKQGLLGRFSFIRREEPKRLIPDIAEEVDTEKIRTIEGVLVRQLRAIGKKEGVFTFTKEAKDIFREWYISYVKKAAKNKGNKSFSTGFIGRKGDHARKIAMILALSADPFSTGPLIADDKSMLGGIEAAITMEESIKNIFEDTPVKDMFQAQREIEEYIRENGRVSRRLLGHKFYRKITKEMQDVIIGSLERPGIVTRIEEATGQALYYIPDGYRELPLDEIKEKVKKDFEERWMK